MPLTLLWFAIGSSIRITKLNWLDPEAKLSDATGEPSHRDCAIAMFCANLADRSQFGSQAARSKLSQLSQIQEGSGPPTNNESDNIEPNLLIRLIFKDSLPFQIDLRYPSNGIEPTDTRTGACDTYVWGKLKLIPLLQLQSIHFKNSLVIDMEL